MLSKRWHQIKRNVLIHTVKFHIVYFVYSLILLQIERSRERAKAYAIPKEYLKGIDLSKASKADDKRETKI